MSKTLAALKVLKEEEARLNEQLRLERGRKTLWCGCGMRHRINTLTAVQTHFYVRPHGCTEGDYWLPGEVQFICPRTQHRTRLLFNVPYENRDKFDKDPENKFRLLYLPLFKTVIHEHSNGPRYKFWNSYNVDENQRYYHLLPGM